MASDMLGWNEMLSPSLCLNASSKWYVPLAATSQVPHNLIAQRRCQNMDSGIRGASFSIIKISK